MDGSAVWELSKENVQPAKRGRDVSKLGGGLAPRMVDSRAQKRRCEHKRLRECSHLAPAGCTRRPLRRA